jgi:hypothetical protein
VLAYVGFKRAPGINTSAGFVRARAFLDSPGEQSVLREEEGERGRLSLSLFLCIGFPLMRGIRG